MAKEICISSTPHETRLAILEDDQLAEIYYERENEYTLAGSIYNGRVTRVLPGMQSAFVDIGLERDAFLYVTDFLELEDPEESDELERATTNGSAQPPREVRHERTERPERAERAERPERQERSERRDRQERSEERRGAERREQERREPVPEEIEESESFAAIATPTPAEVAEPEQLVAGEEEQSGARRWRGRRRRRRGGSASQPSELQEESFVEEPQAEAVEVHAEVAPRSAAPVLLLESDDFEQVSEPETVSAVAPEIQAAAQVVEERPRRERRQPAEAKPFVLPGESLSKYGGKPTDEPAKKEEPKAAARPASSFKPSTLIEAPLAWDGSGLLPGESLARHRAPESAAAPKIEVLAGTVSGEELEEIEELIAEATQPEAPKAALVVEEEEMMEEEELAPESDRSASHNVDPAAPQGFRLFGFGSNKKKDDDKGGVDADGGFVEEELVEEETTAAPAEARRPRERGEGNGRRRDRSGRNREQREPREPREAREPRESRELQEEERPRQNEYSEMMEDAHFGHQHEAEEEEEQGEGQRRGERRDRNRRTGRGSERPQAGRGGRGPSRRSAQTTDLPIISDLLKPGQEILVQIAKEPIAKKGARITSHIALPGRFLVFMPTVSHVGVSRKIDSDEERQRLKRILIHERGESQGGFIVRTAAEGASEEELRADLRFLLHLWSEIKQRSDSSKSPALIYHDLGLIERILRDQVSSDFSNIWVDSQEDYERIVRFLNRFSPSLVRRVKLYTKETPLFEHFGIDDEISKALRSKVWLKSGGSIVINQTEALVAIDINTGKYVGKSARLEDTIVKTNLDAVPEIVRQIRLRDLGGIIVIDFIDMDERKNRAKVLAALEEALKTDKAPTKVLQFNDFGLVAITRKRVKQSLERTLSVPCPTCQATGMVKSPATVVNEIYVEMRKMRKHFESEDVMLRVNPETVKVLKANNGKWIQEFEELSGRNVLIKSDPALHPEQFDIQG